MDFSSELKRLEEQSCLRRIPGDVPSELIDLTSNDYLGLARRADLQQQFLNSLSNCDEPLMTSSASRLLAGRQSAYNALESQLEQLYGRPAILFNSGWHANTGLLPALVQGAKTLVLADRLIHASVIAGMQLSGARFTRFPHNNMVALERIISREAPDVERIIVIVESIYSMTGDTAPLPQLLEIKERWRDRVVLYIDEAHALGVAGPRGLGLSAGMTGIDVMVGTFGKALASQGAFAVVSDDVKQWIVNKAPSLIFSTMIPPISALWTSFMLTQMIGMEAEREHLRCLQSVFPEAESHIVPCIVGSADRAMQISRLLRQDGYNILPIRRPTVPPGKEMVRISLNASLSLPMIEKLKSCLDHRFYEVV